MAGQNWQYATPMSIGAPGTNWGGGAQAVVMRDPLDALRAQIGNRIPSAQYPDGYLGTLSSRREDRLLNSLNLRATQRSYERGVHKGERIDPTDYFWPAECQPDAGLRRQAAAVRRPIDGAYVSEKAAPIGTIYEQMQAASNQLPMTPRGRIRPLIPEGTPDPIRQAALRSLLPDWRTA